MKKTCLMLLLLLSLIPATLWAGMRIISAGVHSPNVEVTVSEMPVPMPAVEEQIIEYRESARRR